MQVIKDATRAKVILVDNRSYDAVVKGVEPDKDLAVLKIQAPPGLTPISVGSSSGLQASSACKARVPPAAAARASDCTKGWQAC